MYPFGSSARAGLGDPPLVLRTKLDVDRANARFNAQTGGGVHVATVPTPISRGQALGAMLAAGTPQSALLMVAAQSAVETNAWGTGASRPGRGYNNANAGNVTPSAGQLAAGIAWMDQNVPGMKYISYGADHVAGAKGMLGWLQSHGLLGYATAGDLAGYMGRLQAGCYLGCVGQVDGTGRTVQQSDYTNYQAGIASWMRTLAGVAPVAPPGGGIAGTSILQDLLIAAAALAIVGSGVYLASEYLAAPRRRLR